jgi:hypothetical protein
MENEKNEKMLAHVEKWQRSGMSIREYFQSIGVPKGRFEYWTKKARATNNPQNKYPEFIELSTSDKSIHCGQAQMPSSQWPQIVLTFPSGLCLKIYR